MRARFSSGTGRTSGGGETSGSSTLPPSASAAEPSMPSSAGRRVSPSRARASGKANATVGGCGANFCGWCASCDRDGFALRTFLASVLRAQTGYSLSWKRRVTPAGRLWWVLVMSGHPSDATGSGSSDDWPTPSAEPYGTNQGGAAGRVGPIRPSLDRLVRDWPTPRASENEQRTTKHPPSVADGHGRTLAAEVLAWPTPCATDAKAAGGRNAATGATHPGTSLTDAVVYGGGRHGRGRRSIRGKRLVALNPAWVAQLMGFPDGWL